MIEGITVLSQEPILTSILGLWIVVGLILTLILSIVMGIKEQDVSFGFFIFYFGALMTSFSGVIVDCIVQQPTGEYEYKVIIDDSVSMTEFYEHYEIIDQEGQIFTIRELKNNNN